MCESNAFLSKDGGEKLLMENVAFVKPEGGKLKLSDLFGTDISGNYEIVEIDLMGHRIVLKEKG